MLKHNVRHIEIIIIMRKMLMRNLIMIFQKLRKRIIKIPGIEIPFAVRKVSYFSEDLVLSFLKIPFS